MISDRSWKMGFENKHPGNGGNKTAQQTGRCSGVCRNLQRMRWRCSGHRQHRLKAPTLGEDPAVIRKILDHLEAMGALAGSCQLPSCRAPPELDLKTML